MDSISSQVITIPCPTGKQVYFASDFHLGAPDHNASLRRERFVVQWLQDAAKDAAHIFLVGDLFDFWFEYKKVIPKGYIRLLGKLAELTDKGIPVTVFIGNHDMWMNGYFEKELNIPVFHHPQTFLIGEKKFLIGHGDGLGPGDHRYKLLKKILRGRFSRSLFAALPPQWGIGLANSFSSRSRIMTEENTFLGEDKEWLVQYSEEILQQEHFDYFIFGHRHLPLNIKVGDDSRYINLGDWIRYFTYGVFDGEEIRLKTFIQ
ncbi:MAG: UDP-2,3-diacylglucosamine diphosphatase [Chitinophagaceae bacterium]